MPWSLAGRLLARDWRSGEVLVLLTALVIAVAAMTAVTFFTSRVGEAVTQEAGESLAADIRIESTSPLPDELDRLAADNGIATADVVQFRSVLVAGEQSSLADVRGVSSEYPLRGEVRVAERLGGEPRRAEGIPARGEVWAEPSLLARLGLEVGDSLDLGSERVRVTRTLEFRPDEGWRLMELAPTLLVSRADVLASGLIRPGSIVEYEALYAGGAADLERFRRAFEPLLGPDHEVDDFRDARPEVRSSVEEAERFLLLAALVSVLLGGVAVAMAARRFVARRLDGVALMKCLGAKHREIMRLNLTQLALLVAAASVLGGAVGYVAQGGLTWLLADFVETELPSAGLRGAVLGPVTALVVAVGFALPPLLQLGGVPPARVLRHDLEPPPLKYVTIYGVATAAVTAMLYGLFGDLELIVYVVGGAIATFGVLYAAGRVLVLALNRVRGSAGVAWRYGIANVARRGRESSVQVVAFGLGLMVLLLLTLVRTELMDEWQATLPERAPNRFLINIQPGERGGVEDIVTRAGIDAPEFTPLLRARISHVNGTPLDEYEARDGRAARELNDEINLTWAEQPNIGNEVVSGRWWDAGETEPQLSLAREMQQETGLGLGDELTFSIGGEPVTVAITSIRNVRWDSFRPNFFMVANPQAFEQQAHTFITSFHAAPEQRGAALDVVREYPGISVIDIESVLAMVRAAMDRAALAVQYVFMFTLAAGFTVLLAAIQATRDERVFESAVLRTLGARRSVVLKAVAAEFTALGLLAGTLATAGAAVIGYLISTQLFDLAYSPGPALWIVGLVAGVLIVGVSGTLAVRSVVNESPVVTLRGA